MMGETITFSLPGPIDSVQKERATEWLKEAGTTIPPIKGPIARRDGLAFPGKPGTNLRPRGAIAVQVS